VTISEESRQNSTTLRAILNWDRSIGASGAQKHNLLKELMREKRKRPVSFNPSIKSNQCEDFRRQAGRLPSK
jgi:hypothetical protein